MPEETPMWGQPPESALNGVEGAFRRAKLDDLSHTRQASPSYAAWIPRRGIALRAIFRMQPVFYRVEVLRDMPQDQRDRQLHITAVTFGGRYSFPIIREA